MNIMPRSLRARCGLLVIGLSLIAPLASAQDAKAIIAASAAAMGVNGLDSITYYGAGANYNLGQNSHPENPWPRTNLNDYRRTIDFTQPASRASAVTVAAPAQGGPATQGMFQQNITPAQPTWAMQLEIWITPWGFLKGAAANNATVRTTGRGAARQHVVTWSPAAPKAPSGQSYRVVGTINAQTNLVERVETWLEHPIFGVMPVEALYSGYRDNHGVKFPAQIVQKRAGWPTFDAFIQGAVANPPNLQALLTPPAAAAGAGRGGAAGGGGGAAAGGRGGAAAGGPAAPAATPPPISEKLADGVWRITGGYVALAVEFSDHIWIFEAGPQNEARSQAILAEARRVIPNKPIRYGVLSHHHADHTSGVGNLVAEGVTIVAHELAVPYFTRALANPRTLVGDAMAKAGRKPVFSPVVGDKRVFQDATRTVELHVMKGLPHADGLMIAYLPKERIIAYADMFNMPAPNAAPPAEANVAHVVMADNLERLQLDFDTVISVHAPNPDRPIRRADIYQTIPGRVMPPAAR
jgi:glyoxylase-like metal-dependent hydrolase (beta-lactamase superfamily II)